MANVKANTISNGTNTAYVPNALKIEGDRLVLYNEENDSFRSSVPIDDLMPSTSISNDPRQKVYYASSYITDAEASTNCTIRINSMIEEVYDNGGGVIKFDGIVYRFSALFIMSNVYLEGCGQGNTIFQRLNNTQTTTLQDQYGPNGSGFINIDQSVTNFGIKDITIYGNNNHRLNASDGFDYYTAGDSNIIDGIVIGNSSTDISYTNGSTRIIDREVLYTSSVIPNSAVEYRTYKYGIFENIAVIGFSGCGIYVGKYTKDMVFRNIKVHCNMAHGIFCYCSKALFDNIECEFNGSYGIYEMGHDNQWKNIKSTYNGFFNHLVYGVYSEGENDIFDTMIISDNWCGGINISSSINSQYNNLLVKINGYRSSNIAAGENMAPKDSDLITISNAIRCRIQATISNHRSDLGIVANYPLRVLTGCQNNIIDIIQDSNCANQNSVVMEQEITNEEVNYTISSNIVRYLQS